MSYIDEIVGFHPANEQEESDRKLMLQYIADNADTVLYRENEIAHITCSGFILNPARTKALMVHHNIRGVWAWTGGHADGETDLLRVALEEAREETGAREIRPLRPGIASIDILTMFGHFRRGRYVSAHLHLSVAYLLVCEEDQALRVKPDENTAVEWLSVDQFTPERFGAADAYLYGKMLRRAGA